VIDKVQEFLQEIEAENQFINGSPVRSIREVQENGTDLLIGDIDLKRELPDVAWAEKEDADNLLKPAGDPTIVWTIGDTETTQSNQDFLAPSHHRRGIMSAALRTLIEGWAIPRMNCRRMLVTAFVGNVASVGVFRKVGFKHVRDVENAIALPEGRGGHLKSLHILKWEYPETGYMDPLHSSPTASPSFHPRSTAMASQPQTYSHTGHSDYLQSSPIPRTRSSTESSATKASGLRRDSLQDGSDAPDEVVPTSFDENALRCGVNCLLDRIKQGMASAREAAVFLQKRAALETDLGRSMHKLAVATKSAYAANECKAGTFATAWENSMTLHETIAENRLKLSANLTKMSEDLSNLAKEFKDTHTSYERTLLDSEAAADKAKARFDAAQEELERFLYAKEGENARDARMVPPQPGKDGKKGPIGITKAVAKQGGMLLQRKNPAALQRQEDDVRGKMLAAADAYRKLLLDTQALRQEYFNFQLPRTLRVSISTPQLPIPYIDSFQSLKELNDEIDTGMQYHLSRYAYLLESSLLSDAVTLVPKAAEDGPGLKSIMESIDNRTDFKAYVQNYRVVHQGMYRGPRREAYNDRSASNLNHGYASQVNLHSARNLGAGGSGVFGVDLKEQMERDGVETPKILIKCCEAIERYGLDIQGIYRINGTVTKAQQLRELMDRDLNADQWTSDINVVADVLKKWLRELPDPLMTMELQAGFIEAASQ
ncbi:974_t:CDS:2, partial [Acaulospora colombiana]